MNFESEKTIYNIHSAFLLEYSQATSCLSEFREAVTSFFLRIISENEDHPSERLDDNIKDIQEICFFLKTFSSEAALHTQLLKSKHEEDEVPSPEVIEEQLDDSYFEYKPPENPNEVYPFELYPDIFTYQSIDPTQFTVGVEKEFFVSYIKDDSNFLFFLMNASQVEIHTKMNTLTDCSSRCLDIVIKQPEFRYDVIPSVGVIFGILLDGVIVRAVRENCLKRQPKTFKVLLIDFGEIMEIAKDYKMYWLPEAMQKIPGQAVFCKLSAGENEDCENENLLRDKLETKQNIRIDRVYKNMLEVTFLPSPPPPTATITAPATTTIEIVTNGTIPKNHETKTASMPINSAGSQLPSKLSSSSSSSSNPFPEPKKGNVSLTQEELDELYEEPLNTENALEAVMGYRPQDEKRICKFFDPKTNACFKGSHCKLEHTTILKDGWTKDQREFKVKIHSQIPMPEVGKKINLLVTYVDDVDTFYGQIVHKNCKSLSDLTADQIFEKINAPEMTAKLRNFSQPPGEFELVFALFCEEWYRAKILQKISDTEYRVFFVDYGNCSIKNLNEMRQWHDAFDHYPFQALECKLDNISKLKKKDENAIAFFEKLVLSKSVTATVRSNAGILLVTLEDEEKFDIGEQLCAAQFVKSKPTTQFASQHFPG